MSWKDKVALDARLIILRELAQQMNGTLNSVSLRRVLDVYFVRPVEWIDTQLVKLAQLEAIELTRAGDIAIAKITPAGRDHLDERSIISGITPPAEFR
ncbi:hypothetical protein [Sphingopyxis sp. GW247-27LB]|uniref:VpaChn25_0724 family phage protein n=1 Tax=Sphingopyxis sp. GW247-27LB TaxID=2012632 RepID=UPI000BA6C07E|nr:hypothetical protein [Sphingopyxis sp. GW247-27LB]PAL20207.1 hypothetical protein CD928_17520 [Sphingopyxis sp. GW247-27LB]